MNEIILTEGIKTNADLASWFRVKETSFKNVKKKKLEILKQYADFEELKGGRVNIIKVYRCVYEKEKSKNYQVVRDAVEKEWKEVDIGTRVAKRICDKYKDDLSISPKTVYVYTIEGRTELYGRPRKIRDEEQKRGTKGYCFYIFAKDTERGLEELSVEENRYKNKLVKKYYGSDFGEKVAFVQSLIRDGEIKEEEFYETLRGLTNPDEIYDNFMRELQSYLGYPVVRATKVVRDTVDFEVLLMTRGNQEIL